MTAIFVIYTSIKANKISVKESTESVEQVGTQVPSGCDYSNVDLFNGRGWNETTRGSCVPL